MANPCYCCCGVATGARILALVSLVIAVLLVGTSSKILKETYVELDPGLSLFSLDVSEAENKGTSSRNENEGNKNANTTQIRSESEKEAKIVLICSGIGVAVGAFQLLTSFLLLIGAAGRSGAPSAIFSSVNSIGFVGILACLVCLFHYNHIHFEQPEKLMDNFQDKLNYWLLAMISDEVFLVYAICATCCFIRA